MFRKSSFFSWQAAWVWTPSFYSISKRQQSTSMTLLWDTHVHVARAHFATHVRALDRLYAVHQRGVLALCRMWVSSLSHMPLFLHNQDAYIRPVDRRAADERAHARAGVATRLHVRIYSTHRNGKCNQCTNLRRSPLERDRRYGAPLGTWHVRTHVHVFACIASARARRSHRTRSHANSSISDELF